MKTLYLECAMGAAGDMLMAALLELHPNPEEFIHRMNHLGIPGVAVMAETSVKGGITGTHISVTVGGIDEDDHHHERQHEHEHEHEHAHGHEHEHHHSDMQAIQHIIGHLNLPNEVRKDVLAVYSLIAEAESHAHGKPVSEIHFHEVGTMDAIADITGVCLLLHELNPQKILASPIHVGSGQIKCAHGILPVPAPATAYVLRGVPMYGGAIKGELCTPTGAALLKHFASAFGDMPPMITEKIGYGMGKKEFEAANCVRAIWGNTADAPSQKISELSCNLDDMTPETVAFACEQLYAAGAIEVFTTAINMKKGRSGILLTCLCHQDKKEAVVQAVFTHTTTIGLREHLCDRFTLTRRQCTRQTPCGEINIKLSEGFGVKREKPEYEDLARIAREQNISLAEVVKLLKS